MSYLDIIILTIILLPAVWGFRKGVLKSIFSLLGLVTGLTFATQFHPGLSMLLGRFIRDERLLDAVSFISILLFFYLMGALIAGKITHKSFITEIIDKIGGLILGGFKGLIAVSIILILLDGIGLISDSQKRNSIAFGRIYQIAPSTYNTVKSFIPVSKKNFFELFDIVGKDSNKK